LAKQKISDLNCLSPQGEFLNRLEQALDLSKNVLDKAKRDLGNSPLIFNPSYLLYYSFILENSGLQDRRYGLRHPFVMGNELVIHYNPSQQCV
jgi:hypothetical protein